MSSPVVDGQGHSVSARAPMQALGASHKPKDALGCSTCKVHVILGYGDDVLKAQTQIFLGKNSPILLVLIHVHGGKCPGILLSADFLSHPPACMFL